MPEDGNAKALLIGSWRLISFDAEFQESGRKEPAFGPDPKGYFVFTATGRAITLITSNNRKPGFSADEKLNLFQSMMAYTGPFTIEGNKLKIAVDVSWDEGWNNGTQERYFKVTHDKLEIVSEWVRSPLHEGNPMVRGILEWHRTQ